MATILDRYKEHVVGAQGKLDDFESVIVSKGDFKRLEDIKVILSSWNNLLLTPTRSYTFDPEYGSDLYKLVWEPADQTTVSAIKDEIQYRLMLYDDRARITDVNIGFLPDGKGFVADVHVEYEGEEQSFSVTISEATISVL